MAITKPNDHDFLFGEEGNSHPGNKLFYQIVMKHKMEFDVQPYRSNMHLKTKYAKKILEDFGRLFTSPGRFLKKEKNSKFWFDVGYDMALKQTEKVLMSLELQKQSQELQETQESSLDIAANQLLSKLSRQGHIQELQASPQGQTINHNISSPKHQSVQHFGQLENNSMANLSQQQQKMSFSNSSSQQIGPMGRCGEASTAAPINASFPQQLQKTLGNNIMMNSSLSQHNSNDISEQKNNTMFSQMPAISGVGNLPAVQAHGANTAIQINQNTSAEWSKLKTTISKQIREMEIEIFRARQLQQQYATQQSNAEEQLQLLKMYQTQMQQFRQQFQQQQNAEQQQQLFQQMQSQFQIQIQNLQMQHKQQIIKQQNTHREEIQMMQTQHQKRLTLH